MLERFRGVIEMIHDVVKELQATAKLTLGV